MDQTLVNKSTRDHHSSKTRQLPINSLQLGGKVDEWRSNPDLLKFGVDGHDEDKEVFLDPSLAEEFNIIAQGELKTWIFLEFSYGVVPKLLLG